MARGARRAIVDVGVEPGPVGAECGGGFGLDAGVGEVLGVLVVAGLTLPGGAVGGPCADPSAGGAGDDAASDSDCAADEGPCLG